MTSRPYSIADFLACTNLIRSDLGNDFGYVVGVRESLSHYDNDLLTEGLF